MRKIYFGSQAETAEENREEGPHYTDQEKQILEVEEILDVFGDSYLNAHLLYAAVDLIVVRLFPEMAEKPVTQLRAERLDPFT